MSGTLHCLLFGDPQISLDENPLTGFISIKAQALLYYLAATRQSHSRDHLAALFWGHMPSAAARKNLTKALSNLRSLVGGHLVTDRQSATLQLDAVTVDLHTFQTLLHPAHTTAADEKKNVQEFPVDRIWQADALHRSPFLQDLTIDDAPDFELWLTETRVTCQQMLIAALEKAADQALQAEDLDLAQALTARTLQREPTWEAAHRRTMTLLARLGKVDEALVHYQQCRHVLEQELGVEPDKETTLLYQTLRATHKPPPHNLPTATTRFVGRETELLALKTLVCDADCRLLTITGAGGVGKTRLALQLADLFAQPTAHHTPDCSFPDGIYLLSLTALDNANTITAMLAERLGFTFYDEGNAKQQLLDALQDKRMLLVLDNVEHLVDTTAAMHGAQNSTASPQIPSELIALVAEMLAGSPHLKFVMTSRTRLNMQGERLFSLGGLHYPAQSAPFIAHSTLEHDERTELTESAAIARKLNDTEYSAIQLFVQSARRLQAHYVLLDRDWPAVVRICQLVQGMPLGILLAAAWMDVYTPAEIADEISRSLDFLEADLPDLPLRQRSIRAAIDHSWRMLAPPEQAFFQRLSIFRGSFSRHAAQQIADATPRLLQSLVKKSLLQPIVQGRFLLHELLRQYTAETLADDEVTALELRNRHSRYFAQAALTWAAALKDARQQQTLKAMDADSENLHVAWQWLIATEDVDAQLEMVNGLCQFYLWRGRYQEGIDTVKPALQRLTFLRGQHDAETVARLRVLLTTWHGLFLRVLGHHVEARQQLEAALAQLQSAPHFGEKAGDESEEEFSGETAFVWLQLGNTLRETDRHRAKLCYNESLACYRATGDAWGTANALAALGWLIQHLGAYDDARQIYQESLALRQTLRDQRGIAGCLRALGGITLYQGNHDEAERLIRRSIAIYGEMDDQAGIAAGLGKLGEALTLLGRAAEAVDPLEESIALYHTLGLQEEEMFAHAVLAHTSIHLGNYAAALHYAQVADSYFRPHHAQRGIAYTMLIQGWAHLGQEALAAADDLLQQSVHIYQSIGQLDELGQAQALLGISAYQQGDYPKAQTLRAAAEQTATAIQAFMPLTLARFLADLLLYAPTQSSTPPPTVEMNRDREFPEHPLVANSHWFAALQADILSDQT
ncbi:MAG: tetratricopeptide repeat protein [Caldilineaceae bacterium]|nr:tetratricopeptide repeat protein [Caldilineaceae bacterium]